MQESSPSPTACLIIIGNEILSGRTHDKNLPWLAEQLNGIGIRLKEVRVVADDESAIIEAVNSLRPRYDYVFTTGGIGPTHDDITTVCIAKAFAVPVIRHPDAERLLRNHFPPEKINEARMKMADVPQGASLIPNPVSAAPGFRIENVFVMAGVPSIMQAMFDAVQGELRRGQPVYSLTLSSGITEGTYAAGITELQARYPELDIGSYPHIRDGKLGTSLVLRGTDTSMITKAGQETEALLKELGASAIEISRDF
jgi:molybdenum cofactor synthesis domain-containing protein